MSNLLLLPVSFDAKPHIKFARFCTQIATPSTTPPDRAVATEFLINKCGLTAEDITKAFRHRSSLLNKSSHNLEEVLELLNGCGLTTPDQIRKVVLCNPRFFFYRSERNIKSKLSFFRTFMKEEDIAKLVITNARIFNDREDKLKSAISLLQRLGVEGDALSELVARQPRLLMTSEENVLESFKQAEDLGIKKGTKMFATAMRAILGVGKEKLDQRLQCLSSLGFSDKQISDLSRRQPWILGVSKEKLKRNLGFLVNSVGLLLDDLVKYPSLLGYSLETRIIPRYRVLKALKSIKVLNRGIHFPSVIYLTEKRFLEKYIDSNAESSVLWDIYHGEKDGKFINDSECVSGQKDSGKL
jgi:mTERF domain-containing protein